MAKEFKSTSHQILFSLAPSIEEKNKVFFRSENKMKFIMATYKKINIVGLGH